jgi:hypothetical protein
MAWSTSGVMARPRYRRWNRLETSGPITRAVRLYFQPAEVFWRLIIGLPGMLDEFRESMQQFASAIEGSLRREAAPPPQEPRTAPPPEATGAAEFPIIRPGTDPGGRGERPRHRY